MKASEALVATLLGRSPSQYQIPLYQRTFSWNKDNLDRLWDDILIQAREIESGNRDLPPHFLGAVVLAPSPMNRASRSTYIVVDGQQRFTALTLVMAAIRDQYGEADSEARDGINDYFLTNAHGKGDDKLRLLPTQTDRDSYRSIILKQEPRDLEQHQQSAITTTYEFFTARILATIEDDEAPSLEVIEKAVGERLALVEITVDDSENPHAIFESLNNTGLMLSQADLVRNYLFMKLEAESDELYEKYWLALQDRLVRADGSTVKDPQGDGKLAERLGRLLWMQLILEGERETRMEDLYRAKTRWFARHAASKPQLKAYIQEVYRRSGLYQRILNPAIETSAEVRRCLYRLQRWGSAVAEPTLLMILDLRERGGLDDAGTARALQLIESFLVRRMLIGRQIQGLNKVFQRLPSDIGSDPDPLTALHSQLSRERLRWITDSELREHFRRVPFYETGNSSQRRFVLQTLEEAFEHPEPVDLTNRKLTVEHVLPQSPTGEWWMVMREDAALMVPRPDQKELHRELVHLIGNLTLSAENQTLSNFAFDRKKTILARSHLEMNLEISREMRWGRAEILARCDRLAELAVKVWPGPLR